ncbi:MAG: SDR family oxidoreductase [Bdellovibrionota bacterium]
MKLGQNTVLITGGASGIGLALAERFLKAGSEVIVCGRRESVLAEVKHKHPAIHTRVCDVSDPKGRAELIAWATRDFPKLNVLINNAGIQRRVELSRPENWEETAEEISINFEAPVHLSMLAIPHLTKQEKPALINVTSGLSFTPLANVPVYCATKAALHSFTLSLRHQLKKTKIQVLEIIPPAVNTDLGGPGLHTFGVPLDEFADSTMKRLEKGDLEIPYGFSEKASRGSRQELDELFARMNSQDH